MLSACERLGACRLGQVKITPGFDLPARKIIHTVGPRRGQREEELAMCYTNALDLAMHHACRSIAFPGISTGAFGFDKRVAAVRTRLKKKENSCKDGRDYFLPLYGRGRRDLSVAVDGTLRAASNPSYAARPGIRGPITTSRNPARAQFSIDAENNTWIGEFRNGDAAEGLRLRPRPQCCRPPPQLMKSI